MVTQFSNTKLWFHGQKRLKITTLLGWINCVNDVFAPYKISLTAPKFHKIIRYENWFTKAIACTAANTYSKEGTCHGFTDWVITHSGKQESFLVFIWVLALVFAHFSYYIRSWHRKTHINRSHTDKCLPSVFLSIFGATASNWMASALM